MRDDDISKIDHWLSVARSLGDVAAPVVAKLMEIPSHPLLVGLADAATAARLVAAIAPAPLQPVAHALTLDLQRGLRSRSHA